MKISESKKPRDLRGFQIDNDKIGVQSSSDCG